MTNGDRVLRALGNAAVYTVRREDERLVFPFQRVARLRLSETLELQQHYHASAGRIGVMTYLQVVPQETRVYIMDSDGNILGVALVVRQASS